MGHVLENKIHEFCFTTHFMGHCKFNLCHTLWQEPQEMKYSQISRELFSAYYEKYALHIKGNILVYLDNIHCIFRGCSFWSRLEGTLGSRFPMGRLVRLSNTRTDSRDKEINTFCHSDRDILPFGQIHFVIWTNILWSRLGPEIPFGISLVELSNTRTDSGDKRDKRVEGQSAQRHWYQDDKDEDKTKNDGSLPCIHGLTDG